jgi:release factor H-coupled RctB family protein
MGNSQSGASADARPYRLIASQKTWIEGAALEQLANTATLPGVVHAVGFPDLHPGKGTPVGAAFVSRKVIHPRLPGNDIGCAMSFWATDLPARKLKIDRWTGRLEGLDRPYDGDVAPWLGAQGLSPSIHDTGLGTIGGGNHFAELQVVHEVIDRERFAGLDLDRANAAMLILSGSRGLGQAIFEEQMATNGLNELAEGSDQAEAYLARHDEAVRWSIANRSLLAARFAIQIGAQARLVSDVPHNTITREDWGGQAAWVHRKGAATSNAPAIMIPGSRGTLSYLVAPTGDREAAAFSLAHGAGRRWQRGYAKPRLSHKYRVEDLQRTELGGRIICEDRELLYEEAPQAYKDIGRVVEDLTDAGLVAVIAIYKPVLTYKVRRRDDE